MLREHRGSSSGGDSDGGSGRDGGRGSGEDIGRGSGKSKARGSKLNSAAKPKRKKPPDAQIACRCAGKPQMAFRFGIV